MHHKFYIFIILLCGWMELAGGAVSDFAFCYRLQEDYTIARLPDISLADIGWVSQDSTNNLRFAPKTGKSEYRYLDGRLCCYFMAVKGSGATVYRMNGSCERFVANAGLNERTADNAEVRFEIWSDRNMIFQSKTINKFSRPILINVEIPLECRKLKLLTVVKGDIGGGEAIWNNPGFTLRGQRAAVAQCELFLPTDLAGNCQIKILNPEGKEVNYRITSGENTNPLLVQFDTSDLSPEYLAYIISGVDSEPLKHNWRGIGGLQLETRLVMNKKEQVFTHPGFMEAWNNDSTFVGTLFVDNIHHAIPVLNLSLVHNLYSRAGDGFGLYTYTGYFKVLARSEYDFATMSVWGSTVFIDDKFVVQWPDRHDFHGGRRCEYTGSVFLEPGIHKIEYMNYNRWPNQLTTCAWRKSGDNYRIMGGGDFVPVSYYHATECIAAEFNPTRELFSWQIIDDIRTDINSPALIAVNFAVIPTVTDKKYEYHWDFSDGIIALGRSVEHIYLKKGAYPVTLEVRESGKSVFTVKQIVNADIDRYKLAYDARDMSIFDNVIARIYLEHVDIESLQGFYEFARLIQNANWQSIAAEVLCSKEAGELLIAENIDFYYRLAAYLSSLEIGRYAQSMDIMAKAVNTPSIANSRLSDLRLLYIRMLLDYQGDYTLAAEQLALLDTSLNIEQITRREILRAETQLGNGKAVTESFFSRPTGSLADETTRQLRNSSNIQQALKAVGSTDKEDIQNSYNTLMNLLAGSPNLILDAHFNLARLALLRAAAEYRQVYNIASRCQNMSMADNYEPKLLYYRILSLIELGQPERAKEIFRKLQNDYPYCPETAEIGNLSGISNYSN